jgi:serine/threonine protein kinase
MVDNASTTEEEKRSVFSILVDILRRLDSKNVAHNDLVEENIIVSISSPFEVTLVDFGSARYKTEEFDNALDKNLPPELFDRGVFDYDRFTMWSLGKMIQRTVKSNETVDDLISMLLVSSECRHTLDQVFDHPYFAIGDDEHL